MKKHYYILVLLFLALGCKEAPVYHKGKVNAYKLLTIQKEYIAGANISIDFQTTSATEETFLWVSNAFGSVILTPKTEKDGISFELPNIIIEKAGSFTWRLVAKNQNQQEGEIVILPNKKEAIQITSYLGPRSISAGGTDFSMLIVTPTDRFDNPLLDSTTITSAYQFNDVIDKQELSVKNLIAWQHIYSPNQSGRILITASHQEYNSQEQTAVIYPALPKDFKITYQRNHEYADGNQIIRFSTTTIKDTFGNVITDGTMVSFLIVNSRGMQLKTLGTTINGVATAEILHPDQAETWNITAYITGAAKSETVSVIFNAAIKDYNLVWSETNSILAITNITSFMGQWAPDGITARLKVFDSNDILVATEKATTRLGKASFELPKDFYKNGSYKVIVTVAGIAKTQNVSFK